MDAVAEDRVRKPILTRDDAFRLGEAIYEERLKPILEPSQNGRIVALDVVSGEYAVADEPMEATKQLLARKHDAQILRMRVGGGGVYHFGGRGNWRFR